MFDGLAYPRLSHFPFWGSAVPSHWNVLPGLAVLAENQRRNADLAEGQVLSLSYGRVVVKPIEKQRGLVPASYESYQVLEPDEIVIRPTDLQNDQTSIRVGLVRDRGIITSAYIGLRSREPWTSGYAHAYLAAVDASKRIYGMGSGLRQQLGWSDLRRMPCLVPPIEEQRSIVAFLGNANARVAAAISAKRRLIALLREQRRVIAESVVLGTEGTAGATRDSGIDWLGDVPDSWPLIPARYVFRVVNRRPVGGEPQLSVTQASGLVRTSVMVESAMQAQDLERFQACIPGDLVLNKYKAHLGVFWGAAEPGLITPNYTVFRPVQKVNNRYFEYLFRTSRYLRAFRSMVYGVTEGMSPLYAKDFARMPLLCPPVDVQERAVDEIADRATEIDRAIAKATAEIRLLGEFRDRLATDVVTGQVDVRAAAHRLPPPGSLDNMDPEDGAEFDEPAGEVEMRSGV